MKWKRHEHTKKDLASKIDHLVKEVVDAKEKTLKQKQATDDAETKIDCLVKEVTNAKEVAAKESEGKTYAKAALNHEKTKNDRLLQDLAASEQLMEKAKTELATFLEKQSLSKAATKKPINELGADNKRLLKDLIETCKTREETRQLRGDLRKMERRYKLLQTHPTGGTDTSTWEGFLDGLKVMENIASAMHKDHIYADWPWGSKGRTKERLISLRAILKMYP
jgi:hypothetical protein